MTLIKKHWILSLSILVFFLMALCYLVYFSRFRIHGRIIDQYGNGIPNYVVRVYPALFIGRMSGRIFGIKPIHEFCCVTDEAGNYSIDSGFFRMKEAELALADEKVTSDGQFMHYGGPSQWSRYYKASTSGAWEQIIYPKTIKYDDTKAVDVMVGRSGPPERLLVFNRNLKWKGEIPNEVWLSVDILNGIFKEGKDDTSDIFVHIKDLARYCHHNDCPVPLAPTFEFVASKGGGVQFVKDPFYCEAPEMGYKDTICAQSIKKGQTWLNEWKVDEYLEQPSPISPRVYFTSHDSHVYGRLKILMEKVTYDNPEYNLRIEVFCEANPRGSRNLNSDSQRSGIGPPVTLPFKE